MRVFGETCYAHISKEKCKKLDDTGVKCYFLGYEKNHKAYRLLNADDESIVISRSVTFTGHPEAKAPEKQTGQIFDVDVNEDMVTSSSYEVEEETPSSEKALRTPPMQARQGLTHEHRERPNEAIPSRASNTPGRDGEEEWMVRPVRKKRGITRYEQEYSNVPRDQFNLDDFEDEYDSYHCFAAEEDGEQATTYEEVMTSKYKDEWMRAMQSEMITTHGDLWTCLQAKRLLDANGFTRSSAVQVTRSSSSRHAWLQKVYATSRY